MRVDFHQCPKTSPNKIIVGIMDRRYASPWPRVGEQSEQTCRERARSGCTRCAVSVHAQGARDVPGGGLMLVVGACVVVASGTSPG